MKKLRLFVCLALFAFVLTGVAEEVVPLLQKETLPVLASPDFSGPLDDRFREAKGRWAPGDGEIRVVNIPTEKHIPVLHHLVGLESAVIEVEFYLEKPGPFIVGCDSEKHVGRVIVNAAGMSIAEDSVKPSHQLVSAKLKVTTGEWHQLRVEWKGDRMAAKLDGEILEAQHPYLGAVKSRSWLAAGDGVRIRNLKISGQ